MSEILEDIRQAADECAMQIWQGGCATWFEARDLIQAAICAERERCAYLARNACLVPPDGGSPTEAEAAVCEEAARRIMGDFTGHSASSPSLHTAEQEVG